MVSATAPRFSMVNLPVQGTSWEKSQQPKSSKELPCAQPTAVLRLRTGPMVVPTRLKETCGRWESLVSKLSVPSKSFITGAARRTLISAEPPPATSKLVGWPVTREKVSEAAPWVSVVTLTLVTVSLGHPVLCNVKVIWEEELVGASGKWMK